ncbi:hypothetical protein AUR04nite_25230 [Glutamicibacter uratoxydans]|uniref:UspA domain-containing protein n=1 Tax=Glutamicibacter uratoxydans TaxID=43667 RepID=A0A4Y4DX63_GLUUR|nr:universal stress protein [Glutamicibacter uratoxydans]GED06991.1 hypothetical protein AUR04nite_25230 [Glutamicibacter uratoxydans]
MNSPGRPYVVGVYPGQDPRVVEQASKFARQMNAHLICVWVDPSRYTVDRLPDGTVVSSPIDPESAGSQTQMMPEKLLGAITALLESTGVAWSAVARAGDAAHELGLLAQERNALAVVLGSRPRSLRTTLHELVNGSVAVKLAQRQLHPVLIIPPSEASSSLKRNAL